jgi:hypothetical protein
MILCPLNETFLQEHYNHQQIHYLEKYNSFFVTKFQSKGNEHDYGLLWINYAQKYGINNNDKI